MKGSSLEYGHAADTDNTAIATTAQYHVGMVPSRLCASLALTH